MDIGNLLKKARALSPREFAAEFHCLLLVVPKTNASDDMAFATENLLGDGAGARLAAELGDVLKITKSTRNPFTSRIIVGRARNCDIVLRHPSVSKMHAHFRYSAAGRVEIVDLGSHNQTRVDSERIAPNAPTRIASGSIVQFGDIVTQLVDAPALYELLVQL